MKMTIHMDDGLLDRVVGRTGLGLKVISDYPPPGGGTDEADAGGA